MLRSRKILHSAALPSCWDYSSVAGRRHDSDEYFVLVSANLQAALLEGRGRRLLQRCWRR